MTQHEVLPQGAGETLAGNHTYREVCDTHTFGSRLVGLMDEQRIEAAMTDPETAKAETAWGTMPALVPLEYADSSGYDVGRCHSFFEGEPDLYYYALPPIEATAIKSIEAPGFDEGMVFFDHDEADLVTADRLRGWLESSGYVVTEHPLHDSRAGDDNKQASISLNGFPNPTSDYEKAVSAVDLVTAYEQKVARGEYSADGDGARVVHGDSIEPELADKLWQLYKDRFEWLGENHPISMEDTKEQFDKLLLSPDTVASIYFRNGEPACFAYFTDNTDNIYWLHPQFASQQYLQLHPGEKVLFWPGIVAKADSVLGLSRPVIQLVTKLVTEMQAPYRIVYECTNRSDEYIPSLVERYIAKTGIEIHQLVYDRHYYRCYNVTRAASAAEQ